MLNWIDCCTRSYWTSYHYLTFASYHFTTAYASQHELLSSYSLRVRWYTSLYYVMNCCDGRLFRISLFVLMYKQIYYKYYYLFFWFIYYFYLWNKFILPNLFIYFCWLVSNLKSRKISMSSAFNWISFQNFTRLVQNLC